MLAAILVFGGLQPQEITPPYDLAAKMGFAPDPYNGYLDYVRGASAFTGTMGQRASSGFLNGTVEGKQVTRREARSYLVSRYGKCWDDVVMGNKKTVLSPVVKDLKFTTPLFDLSPIRSLSRVGLAISEVRFEAGDRTGGWSALLDGWEMGMQMEGSGVYIHYLVGQAIQTTVYTAMAKADPLMPEGTALRVASDGEAGLKRRDLLVSMAREEISLGASLKILTDDDWKTMTEDLVRAGNTVDIDAFKAEIPMFSKEIGEAEGYYAELAKRPEMDWHAGIEARHEQLRRFQIGEFLLPEVSNGIPVERFNRNQMRLMLAHAKVSQFYWVNGRFPGSLKEAGFELSDPVSGKAFGYGLKGNRFDIWVDGDEGKVRLGDARPRIGGEPEEVVPLVFRGLGR